FTGRRQRFEYDGSALVTRWFNGKNEGTVVEHDQAGQVVCIRSDDGGTASFEYDANGLVSSAINESIGIEFQRDEYGHIVREIQGDRVVESSYDDRGLRTKRRTSSGHEVEWAYDGNGRVARLGLPGDEWLEFTRDATGRDVERKMRGGFVLHQKFDSADRLTSQWAGLDAGPSKAGAAIADRQYRYDLNDNLTAAHDLPFGDSQYNYDADGRIAGAARETGWSEEFLYDASGDLTRS